jgi:nardilysin
MASVSIAINAGSFNDPANRPGLAHFLEHMIFMGSEKYPDENAFNSLISSNGGYSNAYTENEVTNYQFKINHNELKLALDMKAHLLCKPLLKKDAMLREIQAVDSEFEGNFSYDNVRAELILSESIQDKKHPCAQFGWGNLTSLTASGKDDSLWNDLKSFYD